MIGNIRYPTLSFWQVNPLVCSNKSNWNLLIVDGLAHLVNLDSKVIEIADLGRFPGDILKGHDFDTEFEIFGKKGKIK